MREKTIGGRGLRSLIDRPAGAAAVMKAEPFRKIASISLAVMLFLVLFMGIPANRADASPVPSITLSPSSLSTATGDSYYNQTISASGGAAPYTYTVTTGTLPSGLTLSSGGALSGTVTAAAGPYSLTVQATDHYGNTGSKAYTLTVNSPAITLSPSSLPAGSSGASYSASVSAGGGAAPYTYTVSAGALPSGLTLSSGGGGLSGTVTAAAGPYSFTIQARDVNGYTGAQSYTITIDTSLLAVTGSTPASGSTGVPTNQVVSVSFDKNIQAGSDYGGITFTDASGNSVSFAGSISGSTLTLSPAALNYNTSYIVSIPVGAVQDDAGATLAATCTISFMTSEQGTPSSLIWQILICAQKDTGNDWTCNPGFSGIVQGTNDLGSTTISYQDTNGDGKNDQATVTIHGGYAGYYNSLSLTVVNLGSTSLPLSAVTIGAPDGSGLTTRLLAGKSSHIQPGRRSVVGIDFRVNSAPGGDISFTIGL